MSNYTSGSYASSFAVRTSIEAVRELVEEAKDIASDADLPVDLVLLTLATAWAGVQAGPAD